MARDGWTFEPTVPCGFVYPLDPFPSGQPGTLTWSPAPGLRGVSIELWRTASAGALLSSAVLETKVVTGPVQSTTSKTYEKLTGSDTTGIRDTAIVGTPHEMWAANNRLLIDPLPPAHQHEVPPVQITGYCDGQPSYCSSQYSIKAADARMFDAAAPTFSNASGSLLTYMAPYGGVTTNQLTYSLNAADVGSGVLRSVVEVDGKIATAERSLSGSECAPALGADGLRYYLRQVPCSLTSQLTGRWDSRSVVDGVHTIRLLVEDAAGNSTVVATGDVLVRNTTPIEFGEGKPGTPNGWLDRTTRVSGDAAQLTAWWPGTAVQPSTKPSVVKRCKSASYARKHRLLCLGRPAQSALHHDFDAKSEDTIYGELKTPDGRPVESAKLDVTWQPDALVAPTALRPTGTGPGGTFRIVVPSGASSGRVTLSWLARIGDAAPAARASVTVAVPAATSFKAPRRVRPSANVTFSGALRGPAGTLGDVPLTLQVRNQGQWKTFETATSDDSGRWRTRLKFAARRGTYPVRVKVGKSRSFPFVPGVAAEARILVS